MHTQLVIIQATSLCNINCRYCYLPDRAAARRISPQILEQIFKALFASSFIADEILFLWHAGEPLVLPISFYEQAFQLQERWNVKQVHIVNAFQTNATLITQKWCQFFKTHNVHVGVSIDGPQHIHDANRVNRGGKGTFARTMRGIELLRHNNIPYTAIAVITSSSVGQAELFWQFFSELSPLRLGLNPEEVEGINASSSLHTEENIQRYKEFLKHLLTLNEQAARPVLIREFEELAHQIYEPRPFTYMQTNVPMAIINFDCDGNFSTFSPELLTMTHPEYGDFRFGNILENSLEEIYDNPKFQYIQEQIQQGIRECEKTCAYFSVCGGGSPSNKLYENGTFNSTETRACRLQIQTPTEVLLEHLEEKYIPPSSRTPVSSNPVTIKSYTKE
ncbi:MAG TPA: cyclophane-forming radical SAM/SPASM peptide maturase GrrM/OscB [Ktedonobacteraceae bacterium]|jgi:uncharacterized protein|nr:cyclophane-forming radical SAM/SPASM peptide maturase GrrM/OscB [Ktedonobacteraceae bacterium]